MITSPSLMAALTGELACTSQGFAPLSAFTRKAWPPGMPSTAKYLAFDLSGVKYQLPLASLLMVFVQMSSWATTSVPKTKPTSSDSQNFMLQPPAERIPAVFMISDRWFQILREEIERALPREFRGRLVVTRLAGIVVEPVLRVRIHVDGVRHLRLVQRRLEIRDAGVDALVVAGVVQQQRHLELARFRGGQRAPVEAHRAIDADGFDGGAQRKSTAVAKAHHADLAIVGRVGRQPRHAGQHVAGDAGT